VSGIHVREPARAADVLDSVEQIGRREWEKLVAACNAPVFYSYDFLRSIELHPLSRPSTPFYLVSRAPDGTLEAALVLYLQETVDPFAAQPGSPTLRMLVGGVWHCYDTTLLTSRPVTDDLVMSLAGTMRMLADDLGADVCGLVNVAWEGALADALRAAGLMGNETTPRYRLVPPGTGFTVDDHLAATGRASRRSLRQYVRRAARAGVQITFNEGRDALGDDVLELCTITADKHAPGYYPPTELGELLLRMGEACRVLRIDLDGTLLATSICLLDETRAHFWAGGCRYPREFNWSPQYVLFHAELEAGLALGRRTLEFGRRNDEFKQRYGLQRHRLGRFMVGERT